jgi:hypothetical protein
MTTVFNNIAGGVYHISQKREKERRDKRSAASTELHIAMLSAIAR